MTHQAFSRCEASYGQLPLIEKHNLKDTSGGKVNMVLERVLHNFHPVPVGHSSSWSPELGGLSNEGQGNLSCVLDHGDPLIRPSPPCDDWPSLLST